MKRGKKRLCGAARRRRLLVGVALVLVGCLVLLILADGVVRSIIRGYPMRVAAGVMLEQMDAAMDAVLSKGDYDLTGVDQVRYDDTGAALAIETDTATVNRLKAAFTAELARRLKEYGDTITIRVPIGTLIGHEYTVGRGPQVRFDLRYSYAVSTDLNSTFYEAGINNTLHAIEMDVTNRLFIVIPWGNHSQDVTTKYILSETVLIGKVPDAYTGVYDGSGEIVDDIFDHQATS